MTFSCSDLRLFIMEASKQLFVQVSITIVDSPGDLIFDRDEYFEVNLAMNSLCNTIIEDSPGDIISDLDKYLEVNLDSG